MTHNGDTDPGHFLHHEIVTGWQWGEERDFIMVKGKAGPKGSINRATSSG